MSAELLRVDDLVKLFPVTRGSILRHTVGHVHAVDGVSLTVHEGESIGLVGESDCGKSTLARCILRLIEPTRGRVQFRGEDILSCSQKRLRELRRQMQIFFRIPMDR